MFWSIRLLTQHSSSGGLSGQFVGGGDHAVIDSQRTREVAFPTMDLLILSATQLVWHCAALRLADQIQQRAVFPKNLFHDEAPVWVVLADRRSHFEPIG